jgi:SPP1 family predicted phage head-tail adaptor
MARTEAVVRAEFIDPGAFRHELALEEATIVPDDSGGHAQDWAEVATVFARIEPIAAESRFGADQTLETVTHRVTMRHRDGVASGMRLTRAGRVFDIVTVHDPDETGRYLVCRVREQGR